MENIAGILGLLFGALILNILASTVIRYLLVKIIPTLKPLTKNLIACSIVPVLTLILNPALFLIYLLTALPVFYVHQQSETHSDKTKK